MVYVYIFYAHVRSTFKWIIYKLFGIRVKLRCFFWIQPRIYILVIFANFVHTVDELILWWLMSRQVLPIYTKYTIAYNLVCLPRKIIKDIWDWSHNLSPFLRNRLNNRKAFVWSFCQFCSSIGGSEMKL